MRVTIGGSGGDGEYEWDAPFKEGWQKAEILWASEHTSRAGNECVKVILGLGEHDGGRRKCSYYVSANDMGSRLSNLLEATDLYQEVQANGGALEPADLKGKSILARVGEGVNRDGEREPKIEWLAADDDKPAAVAPASVPVPATTVAGSDDLYGALSDEEIPF